ncbi:MAG: SMP-30/gluconolactonase/LRE family protein [Rhodobacteraceae bacterium]|jgi:DNA-binding IclR family transcriptional regulator/streptogramin lyase|nr:SMP-30/gluconolactonase/LRE family protein [Paracoccaceae bacterium]
MDAAHPTSARRSPAGTALIGKAVDVLEAIAACGGTTDHATLAARCGLPRPTLYRILAALSARGLVRATDGGFGLGYGLVDMATLVWASSDLTTVAAGELRRLRDVTGETAYLAVMEAGSVLSIGRFQGAHTQRSTAALGTLKPLHCTSQGKAFLAHLPDAQRDRLLAGPLAALTPRTITDPMLLRIELARTRARGYAIDDEEIVAGTRCVGAPVLDATGRPVAAVSVAGPSFRITLPRIEYLGEEVLEATRQIAARLTPHAPARTGMPATATVLTDRPGFHGLDPFWDSATATLTWADRYASALLQRDATGAVSLSHTFQARIEALVVTRAGGPVVFHADHVSLPEMNRHLALPGYQVRTACCDAQDRLWVVTTDNRLARMRGDGGLLDGIDLPVAITAARGGAHGALWLASAEAGTLHHFDPSARRLRLFAHVPRAAGAPAGLAETPDGSLWVALLGGWGLIRLNAVGEVVQSLALPVADATGVTLTEDGKALAVTTTRHALRREDLVHAPLSGHVLRVPLMPVTP